jgi:hypothetical protein
MKKKASTIILIFALLINISCSLKKTSPIQFEVSVADSLFDNPINGKALILFHRDTSATLVWGPNPFNPQPFYRFDFKNWDPKEALVIDKFNNWWDKPIDSLNGIYAMQIVIDIDTLERGYFAQGNTYSSKQIININPKDEINIKVNIEHPIPTWTFNESEFIKEEQFQSHALSNFWKYPVRIKAGVVLPESYYSSPNKKYQVVYIFPGFAGHHASISQGDYNIIRYGVNTIGEEKIFVYCNGEFHQGYHHFADSENNGPWGKAFTEEFIQYIEDKYRVIKGSDSRFLMGQSSGAWTSIWLQVNYPELFAGAFACSPDPIDFRATGNNIYRHNANFYYPEILDSSADNSEFNKQMALMEKTIDEYGQFKTWESTFSKKNNNGHHFQLFDRETGKINPIVAEQWKKYDISLIVQSNPEKYRKLLKNKLHIFVSNDDDYGLDESIRLFKNSTDSLQIKVDIQFFEELGHNIWTDDLRKYIHMIIDSKK